jgi:hypothetical protein
LRWKVQIDPGKLWFEVRGAISSIVLTALLALFVPSLHATLERRMHSTGAVPRRLNALRARIVTRLGARVTV